MSSTQKVSCLTFGVQYRILSARCFFQKKRQNTAVFACGGLCNFLTAKSTKNSPTDACAYFVPSNVRNGRLFAGAHAPLPRFLPLLAGTSFNGSGIESDSFAATGGVRSATTGSETLHPAIAPGSGLKPPHYRSERKKSLLRLARPEREAVKA